MGIHCELSVLQNLKEPFVSPKSRLQISTEVLAVRLASRDKKLGAVAFFKGVFSIEQLS